MHGAISTTLRCIYGVLDYQNIRLCPREALFFMTHLPLWVLHSEMGLIEIDKVLMGAPFPAAARKRSLVVVCEMIHLVCSYALSISITSKYLPI
jgi:hypothetical protein